MDVVYIAMAGTHQIWAYFLKDVTWWKNRSASISLAFLKFCPFIRLAICELILYKSNHYHPPPPLYLPIHLSLLLSFHLLVSPTCCASLHSDSQACILPCVCPVNVLDLIQKHFGYSQLGPLQPACSQNQARSYIPDLNSCI